MLVAFNKPYGVLSQFTSEAGHKSLADFGLPKGVYACGRLDHDSEGLLLLSDDGALAHRLTDPKQKLEKVYWAQVERVPDEEALARLRNGVTLRDGLTRPAKARLIEEPVLPPRDPPIRFRKNVPTAWLELAITEGKNRQVRRMTAAVGFPTLRLVRAQVGDYSLKGLELGRWKTISYRSSRFGRPE